jgi:glycosyltransferase involved in cell wall biosynthesis
MRIALLTNFVAPYRVPLFRALAARVEGLRIYVCTAMEPNRAWTPDSSDLDVVRLRSVTIERTWRHPAGFSEPNYLHVPLNVLPALAAFRPDVVISGELGARTLQALTWARYLGRRPLLVWATTSERLEEGRRRETVRRWQLARAAGVLVNGESGARLVRRLGVPDARIFRVPQPVDVARFTGAPAARRGDRAHQLLVVGSLTHLKGVLPFLDAAERWSRQNPGRRLEVTFAGSGPLREIVQARRLPPNMAVSFLGHVAYEDLPGVYAAAGILVFPTLADEWGLVVNEALASGVPVLGSIHAQAVEELVEDGRTGWHFDPVQPGSFDAALARCLDTSPAVLDCMRVAGRERVLDLNPDTGAQCMLEAVRAVA